MRSRVSFPQFDRACVPVGSGVKLRSRALVAGVAVGAVCLLAAACGGDDTSQVTQGAIDVTVPEGVSETTADFMASRPGAGITAAGGNVEGGAPCPAPGSPGAAERVKIAVVTPDVDRLGDIGLGDLVFDSFDHTFDAYINRVNSLGGIGGNCFEFLYYEYGFTNPAEEIGFICTDLPQQQPLVMVAFALSDAITGCATIAGQIPTIGLYSQFPEVFFDQTGGLLRVDHGALEFLLDNGLRSAARSGLFDTADSVGLLYTEDETAPSLQATFAQAADALGLQVATSIGVPPDLSGTIVNITVQQFGALGGNLFDSDEVAFAQATAVLPPDLADLLVSIRQHFIDTAAVLRDAGVNTVVATASWDAVRSLMQAAELIGWYPTWIINDSQFSLIVLTDAPKAQGLNLVQISSRRAADDPIDGLDRGCLSLRNTHTAAEPFAFRFHTDAWNLMTASCDYLDVIFSAVSRVSGPLTREAFLAALNETTYEAAHGSLVEFSEGDLYGSDSFRVLNADPDCVLNDWGCMRPLTGWLPLADAPTGGSTDG